VSDAGTIRGHPSGAREPRNEPIPALFFGIKMQEELIDDYDYELPPERIAQCPAAHRDHSRLLVHERGSGGTEHHRFDDLPQLLQAGDLLVLNDTRVLPARIAARKPTGGRAEVLLLQPLQDSGWWEALVRPSARVAPGSRLETVRGEATLEIGEVLDGGHRRVKLPEGLDLDSVGEPPLPPYIRRPDGATDEDRQRYQTVYATHDGAVAAPTAGLHFTPALLQQLDAVGVERATVTLHVGSGTFEPVRDDRLDDHLMHAERYRVPAETVEAMARTRAGGGRVIAVGTTVVRTLEAWSREGQPVDRWQSTELFIRPGFEFHAVDGMITNFHLPRSTLLVLVSGWLGRETTLALYRDAVEREYRFYSYGDATLLL
jgi:S-adenosylmethionine:tRNA ribosyltransferase-isomerase